MLKHEQLWRALDRYADYYGVTTSGLARKAGLDPTSFNPSKRSTKDGKLRWPSTESLSKVLDATDGTMVELVSFLQDVPGSILSQNIPLLSLPEAQQIFSEQGDDALFDDHGNPVRENWDLMTYPDVNDANAFGLELTDDQFAPVFRQGTTIVMSPNASIRRHDRVVLCMQDGVIRLAELVRQTAHRMDLASILNSSHTETIMAQDVVWMSRIVWASQ